jgi:hypothetical protein
LLFVFLMIAILIGERWNQNVLIWLSLMVKNVENFFLYLLVICASPFENCSLHFPLC